MPIPLRLPLAALVIALLVAGCGGSDKGAAAPTPTAASSGPIVTGPPGTTASVNADPGSSGRPFELDGLESTASRGLPRGFPLKAIPVVRGTLVGGSKGKAGGPFAYTVLVRVPGKDPAAVMRTIAAQLAGVGFSAEPGAGTPTASVATYKSARYDVGVNVIRAQGRTTVTYVVVEH